MTQKTTGGGARDGPRDEGDEGDEAEAAEAAAAPHRSARKGAPHKRAGTSTVCLLVHTKHSRKAGPSSVARRPTAYPGEEHTKVSPTLPPHTKAGQRGGESESPVPRSRDRGAEKARGERRDRQARQDATGTSRSSAAYSRPSLSRRTCTSCSSCWWSCSKEQGEGGERAKDRQ